jgi:purine-binding chemotaxis protein CheW
MDGTEGGGRRELITFRVGQQEFCTDIMAVREIRGWTPTIRIPQSAPHILGMINLRGAVLAIMDLSARLGLGEAEPTVRDVIMVADIDGHTVGLLVSEVSDILSVAPEDIQPSPDVGCDVVKALVKGVISIDERMISLLDLRDLRTGELAEAA